MTPFDCEAVGAAFPKQPVNAVSSVAFLVAAAVLWRRGHRTAAVAVGAAGVGSVLFHGAPSGPASFVHDVGLYATVLVAAIHLWRVLRAGQVPVFAAGTLLAGSVMWLMSKTGGPLCLPHSAVQGHAAWHLLAALSLVLLFADRYVRPTVVFAR